MSQATGRLQDSMSDPVNRITKEMLRIREALIAEQNNVKRRELYAANQALSWALDPSCAAAPSIVLMGTPEARADCQVEPHPVQSSSTGGLDDMPR